MGPPPLLWPSSPHALIPPDLRRRPSRASPTSSPRRTPRRLTSASLDSPRATQSACTDPRRLARTPLTPSSLSAEPQSSSPVPPPSLPAPPLPSEPLPSLSELPTHGVV